MWHNGEMVEIAKIDATSAGFTFGWGVFTTVGIRNGHPLWVEKHLARLRRDAARCEIEIDFSDNEISNGLSAVLAESAVRHGLARLTLCRRDDGRWNHEIGSDFTIGAIETAPLKTHSLHVGFSNTPFGGPLAGVKITSYLPYFWCWKNAVTRGWDEVLLINESNQVIEAARSSVFWIKNGILSFPARSLGPLEGVGREIVLEWAKNQSIETQETEIAPDELAKSDTVFLVSGAAGPRAISTLINEDQDRELPPLSPIFESLRDWWHIQI